MRIGIFGGTFDPPHLGHLILAGEACDQLRLDQILWVLTSDPPHKQEQVIYPVEQRFELLKATVESNPNFRISMVEMEKPSPHYAVDTIRLLAKQYLGAELFYIMGGDSLHDLPTWHEPGELIRESTGLGVMRRPDDEIDFLSLEAKLPGITKKINFIEAPLLQISSRQIRKRIAERRHFRYYLPLSVYDLIQRHHFYSQ